MKVCFVAAEASPLVKVGGLADVVGSLSKVLSKRGHDVRIVIPGYGLIDKTKYNSQPVAQFFIEVLSRKEEVSLKLLFYENLPIYLIENERYFGGRAIYYTEAEDVERFFFFSKAFIEALGYIPWKPDIVHCHDWHTALITLWAKGLPFATLFTIHNLAYQGYFSPSFLTSSGLDIYFQRKDLNIPPKAMALGILYADIITTVSQNYAQEIKTPQFGEGLDHLLRYRSEDLIGILNGIDYDEFNPATDPYLPVNYDASSLEKKERCKAELIRKVGLSPSPSPLIGMVSRLDKQKGFDILSEAVEPLLSEGEIQLIVLGRGRGYYEELVSSLAQRYPSQMKAIIAFDIPLSHLIYAGADLFLMPSEFEPCGLGQLIAMRYGTIPIVRQVGGLADTVKDLSPDLSSGWGFVFKDFNPQALNQAIRRAIKVFSNKTLWQTLQRRAMALDFSWSSSVPLYEKVYQKALEKKARLIA